MSLDYKIIGANIRETRKWRGLTQKELGAAISRTESSIAKYEQGLVEIPNTVLSSIATVLSVDLYSLMDWDQATEALENHINARERVDAAMEQMTPDGQRKVADYAEDILPRYRAGERLSEGGEATPPAREGQSTTPATDVSTEPQEGKE